MSKFPLFALAVLPAIIAPLSAQTIGAEIVGITSATPLVMRQFMNPQLRCLQSSCNLSFEKQTLTNAGGSAYDSRLGGMWITNGLSLACVDVATCNVLCPPQNIPLPPLTAQKPWCTGLAFVDSGAKGSGASGAGWLFASYNTGHIARIDTSGCKFTATFCQITTGLPTGYTTSGLAADDVNRYLYIGATNGSTGNLIVVAPIDPAGSTTPWCTPACRIVPPACSSTSPLGAIQGLAFDACKGTLFVTDGKQTVWGVVTGVGTFLCQMTQLGCCPLNVPISGDVYTGICLRPAPTTSSGQSCTLPSCNTCSSVMQATLVGDANLGNPAFGMGLRNAPSNSNAAAFALNVGACTSPGTNLGYCAPVLVPLAPPPLILLFFGLPAGTGTCGTNLTVPAPLPLSTSLCGQNFSFQWVVRCPATPLGGNNFGITNCVTASISGS